MTDVLVHQSPSPADAPVEIVERKGLGHPDTLADALAERMSIAYSKYCLKEFGAILHHNLDKLYLLGGHATTDLGVFEMTRPITVIIGGRVSTSFAGTAIDYRGLFEQTAREYLATVLPNLDQRWLRFEHRTSDRSRYPTWFHPRGLDDLPERDAPTASDTVAVTAWWPPTPTEQLVLALERHLNQEGAGPRHHHLGQDIKVMAYRRSDHVDVTLNVAVHPHAATTTAAYQDVLNVLQEELEQVAAAILNDHLSYRIQVNTGDKNPFRGKKHYLLGSGTCLEFGEEGFVGRGNGPQGLISVHRPKSVEAAYGKNPTYHAGKVYTIYAQQIAEAVHGFHSVDAQVGIAASHSDPLRTPARVEVGSSSPIDHNAVRRVSKETLEAVDHVGLAVDKSILLPR